MCCDDSIHFHAALWRLPVGCQHAFGAPAEDGEGRGRCVHLTLINPSRPRRQPFRSWVVHIKYNGFTNHFRHHSICLVLETRVSPAEHHHTLFYQSNAPEIVVFFTSVGGGLFTSGRFCCCLLFGGTWPVGAGERGSLSSSLLFARALAFAHRSSPRAAISCFTRLQRNRLASGGWGRERGGFLPPCQSSPECELCCTQKEKDTAGKTITDNGGHWCRHGG